MHASSATYRTVSLYSTDGSDPFPRITLQRLLRHLPHTDSDIDNKPSDVATIRAHSKASAVALRSLRMRHDIGRQTSPYTASLQLRDNGDFTP